ncbi:MAG: hypothetical protein ACLSVD_04120 [Eggerthellaceae bacterium]
MRVRLVHEGPPGRCRRAYDRFLHADLSEARLRRVAFDDARFAGTSFFRTSLAGVDCPLPAVRHRASDAMGELRGCSMDLFQAAGIARRLGVVIKSEDARGSRRSGLRRLRGSRVLFAGGSAHRRFGSSSSLTLARASMMPSRTARRTMK